MQLESDKGEVLLLQHKPDSFNVQKGWQLTCPIRFSNSHTGVSDNRGTPKSSILIGFSIINHPFWGTPIFGNTHILKWSTFELCGFRKVCRSWLRRPWNSGFKSILEAERYLVVLEGFLSISPTIYFSQTGPSFPKSHDLEKGHTSISCMQCNSWQRWVSRSRSNKCWDLTHLSSLLQSSNNIV